MSTGTIGLFAQPGATNCNRHGSRRAGVASHAVPAVPGMVSTTVRPIFADAAGRRAGRHRLCFQEDV
jgi:hypothetical protein